MLQVLICRLMVAGQHGNNMRVAIRADASINIGTGHIMRCLTLAEELKLKGVEVLFICRELVGHLADITRDKGFETLLLPGISGEGDSEENNWLCVPWDQDAEETNKALSGERHWDWLVIDHYGIDERWEKRQRNNAEKIMVIDDLANRTHDCDVLLDQNYYEDMEFRYQGKIPELCRSLIGPEYALIRTEFSEQRKKLSHRDGVVKKILVFFGGIDVVNMTEKVIDAIIELNIQNIIISIVIGEKNPHKEKLSLKCSQLNNIVLHIQVSNMAEMMADADLCVGGGGSTTWERCCLGLPALAWSIADNQKKLLKDSAKAGLVYAPDCENPTVKQISNHLSALLQNSMMCMHMSATGLEMIDAKGSARVANILLKHNIKFRSVELDDEQKIFEWRNDINVREYSRNTEKINIDQHKKWFRQVLADPDKLFIIGSVKKEEIGVLRFDISGEEAEISIYLAPEKHGRGYGAALVESGEEWLLNKRPEVKTILADVLADNKASNKLFEKCGYRVSAMRFQKSIK